MGLKSVKGWQKKKFSHSPCFKDSPMLLHISASLLFIIEYCSIICMDHALFIQSSLNRHFGGFHLLPTVDNPMLAPVYEACKDFSDLAFLCWLTYIVGRYSTGSPETHSSGDHQM